MLLREHYIQPIFKAERRGLSEIIFEVPDLDRALLEMEDKGKTLVMSEDKGMASIDTREKGNILTKLIQKV